MSQRRRLRFCLHVLGVFLCAFADWIAPTHAASQIQAVVDYPNPGLVLQQPFAISGWAVDLQSHAYSGIDQIAVYAAGPIGPQVLLGYASREGRPDVAQHFGRPGYAGDAGYRFTVSGLPAGSYQFGVMVHSAITGAWAGPYVTSVTIPAAPIVVFDAETTGVQPFVVSGLAGDALSTSGSGIGAVHVHAVPLNGGPQILLGAARTGIYRPDAAATYGPTFAYSGWDFTVRGLPPGQYRLRVYAQSAITGIWGDTVSASRTITNNVQMLVETPAANGLVAQPFSLSGAAADLAAVSGSGASVLHIYARHIAPNGQPIGDFIWLGQTVPNIPRPDLAPYVGGNPQFANIGFRLDNINGLPPDTYEIAIFVLSTVSNQFHGFLTRVRVGLTAAPPVLVPPPGEYSAPISISVSSSTPGAVVRFTQDGSEPTDASPIVGSAATLSMPGTARLRAFAPNVFPSATVDASYTFRAAAPTLSPPPGTYEGPQTVTAASATPGAILRFTTDGSEPTEASPAYTGPATIGATISVKVRAFRAGWLPSATVGGLYIIRPAVPVFSVPSGTYTTLQTVTIQTATPGGLIRYTTNGSDPTMASTLYSGPIAVVTPMTLKARTFDAAGEGSSVAALTITYQTAAPTVSPASGVYTTAPLAVTVSSPTSHAVVRYTLDGSEPGPGSPSVPPGGVVTIDQNRILKVQASVPGWPPSVTVSANYQFVVAEPVVTPVSGTYARPFDATATVATPGAIIRYTTNGTEPSESSPVWTGLSNPPNGIYQLVLRAFRTGWTPSSTVARQYQITDVVTATPTVSPAPGVHDVGVVVSVASGDSQSIVRITTDGTDPTEASPQYAGPITLTVPTVVKARAFKPNVVPSNVAGGDYVLRLPAPTVSPAGGTFASAPHPTVSHSVSGVTLRYTLDRHEPTDTSPVVPASCCINIADNTTLKVAAFKTGWAQSSTVTNTYFVGSQTPPVSNTVFQKIAPVGDTARVSDTLRIAVGGTPLVPGTVRIARNGVDVTPTSQISPSSIVVPNLIVAGENLVEVFGLDAAGALAGATFAIFGASSELVITVRSQGGAPLAGATVLLFDSTQEWPLQTLFADVNGIARALVPAGFAGTLTAVANGYHSYVSPVSTSTSVFLEPRNENFERGAEDWSLSYTVDSRFIPHTEGLLPWVVIGGDTARLTADSWALDGSTSDTDLIVGSWGSPVPVTLSRMIRLEPGTQSVALRYRFAANHAGSLYRLSLTVPATGARAEHSFTASSLQQQGQATPGFRDIQSYWLTLSVNLPPGVEEVRLEGVLPADFNPGHTSTWFVIDQVAPIGIHMTSPQLEEWLKDPQDGIVKRQTLQFLSLGPKDGASGVTQVNGTLSFNGNATKRISAVRLEVSRQPNGSPVFSVPIRTDAGAAVLNQTFPASGVLTTGATRELFSLTAAQMAMFSQTSEESVYLTVKAVDESAAEIRAVGGALRSVTKLTDVMADVVRDGQRDPTNCVGTTWTCYGDAWARPTFHRIMRAAQQELAVAVPGGRDAIAIRYNDFSNSNGGHFPTHNFHTEGRHVDGDVDGYLTKDAALARKMAHTARAIRTAMVAAGTTFRSFEVLVEFNPQNPNDPFTAALMAEPSLGGRPMLDYFRNGGRIHRDHFHVQMR